jgi:hypothetical protein
MVCSKASTSVIDHIIYLCGFPDDSTMVKFIKNKLWTDLSDVISLSLDDTNDFKTVNYVTDPLAHHVRKFRGFLVYYLRKCHELSSDLDKDDVIMITKKEFTSYCGSLDYHSDMHLSGYKKRAPKLVIDDELTETEFIPTAPKLVVVDDKLKAPFGGEHSNKRSGGITLIRSNYDATKLENDNSKLDDPHVEDLWGADLGHDYCKDKKKKKGYLIGAHAFGTHNAMSYVIMTSDVDWGPGSYMNTIDYISQFYSVKEEDIHEWGVLDKLISDQDDGEYQEMMNE